MATTPIPERVRWAVEVLAPRPGERVLDIGSGTGASVELLLEALGGADAASGIRPVAVVSARHPPSTAAPWT